MPEFIPVKKPIDLDLDESLAYSWLILGSTRSGKSYLINELLGKFFGRKINILMTDSTSARIYNEPGFFKDECIMCPGFTPELINDCWKINKKTDNKYTFNFIFDDLVGNKVRNSEVMTKLFTVMRNANIGCQIVGQGYSIVSPIMRSNTNFVFLGYMNNDESIEKSIKAFLLSFFPTEMNMVDKIKSYKMITSRNHFIFINNLTGETYVIKV
jgi:GTPase SAR1 family protein